MKTDDIQFLNQLMLSMLEGEKKLEVFYGKKDTEKFNETKRILLEIQKKISDILNG